MKPAWVALVIALLGSLSGCWRSPTMLGAPDVVRDCDERQEAMARSLGADQALTERPAGFESVQTFSKLPCEDDDGIGAVGWRAPANLESESEIRAFYKEHADEWSLRLAADRPYVAPGPTQFVTGSPQLCFTSTRYPGSLLTVVYLSDIDDPAVEIFVAYKVSTEELSCSMWS